MKEAFEAALKENRYDQVCRLIFADWLDDNDCPEEADKQRAWTPEWQQADDWMREFADSVGLKYEEVIEAGKEFQVDGDLWAREGMGEDARDAMYNNSTREDYWKNWEIVTGKPVDESTKEGTVFSCSC